MTGRYEPLGAPEQSSAGRYLWWLVSTQRRRAVAGALLGSIWMVGLTLPPYVLSRAIDAGLQRKDSVALFGWGAALLGVGVLNAWVSVMRHRTMTRVRLHGLFLTARAVVLHSTKLGAALPRQVTTGEVVTTGIGDVQLIADTLTIVGPGVGAVLGYIVVADLLLSVSPLLAVVVLVGVPLLMVLLSPLLRRLRDAETTYRELLGGIAARFGDLAAGLRILNALGGKDVFAAQHRSDSRKLREEGYRVGAVTSWIQALGVGLPMLFLAAVTWLAARMAVEGNITVGELVAVYGYTAVLVVPVSFFIRSAYELNRGLVAARRVIRFLNLEPDAVGGHTADAPARPSPLRDAVSGVEVAPGQLTALVSARSSETAAVVDRLGRFAESAATWGDVPLCEVPVEQVRQRIMVADNDAYLFAGTLREVIAGRGNPDSEAIACAVHAAVADDIVQGLPRGLDSTIDMQGRNLSGGQRQRVRLARVLLADPEVLMAIEPTSAVDAHTEAAMAARLRSARVGRTTVVTSTSPLLLDQADTVFYLVDGKVVAHGSHHELLCRQAGYRSLVSRETYDGHEVQAAEATVPGQATRDPKAVASTHGSEGVHG